MILWSDETIFKNEEVFDPNYLPPEILFREAQINDLIYCLRPAVKGISPGNVLCIGPPSSGKTTVVKYLIEKLKENGVMAVYINCSTLNTTYNLFARLYELVCNKIPPQKGVPLFRLVEEINENCNLIIVVLDDIDFLHEKTLNEVLKTFLKNMKVSIVAVSMGKGFITRMDPYLGSIFHFHEVCFSLYTKDEMRKILEWRVKNGFNPGVMTEEAFNKILELVSENGDVRYGLFLLRRSGLNAERRGSRKIEIIDVELAREGEESIAIAKSLSALNSDERETLKIIYSLDGEITTGEIYEILRSEVGMYYERFYEIMDKLERLRFIDLIFERKGRGRTRVIVRRYDKKVILKALREIYS